MVCAATIQIPNIINLFYRNMACIKNIFCILFCWEIWSITKLSMQRFAKCRTSCICCSIFILAYYNSISCIYHTAYLNYSNLILFQFETCCFCTSCPPFLWEVLSNFQGFLGSKTCAKSTFNWVAPNYNLLASCDSKKLINC